MSVEASWIDFIHVTRDVDTSEKVGIVILDTSNCVAQDLDADGAREVAAHLVTLADEVDRDKARRRLRRLPDAAERLRDRDGGV